MTKFSEVSEDTQFLFDNVLANISIQDYIQFKVLNCVNEKTPVKIVKPNDITNYISNGAIDLIVIVNETLLDELRTNGDEIVQILFDEVLCQVHFDTEKDKLNLIKPDFITFTGMISKYKDKLSVAKETVRLLMQQKDDIAKEAKETKLANKKKK
jgi:hypothetical protein